MPPALTRTLLGTVEAERAHPDPTDQPGVAVSRSLGVILAGGEGSRLSPLTAHRQKPAVRFGARHRLIDFPLSNLANSGIRDIVLLTQQESAALEQHISTVWSGVRTTAGEIRCLPPRLPSSCGQYQGSADALYQNLDFIVRRSPEQVVVVAADHICRIDPAKMLGAHISSGAGVTIATVAVPEDQANLFGIIAADETGRVRGFTEKPAPHSRPRPGHPGQVLASMGNYIFDTDTLDRALRLDAADASSRHDLGANIIPGLAAAGQAFVYDFTADLLPGQATHEGGYWRDVGTLDAYYQANMDLVAPVPHFSLDNELWPIHPGVSTTDRARVLFDSVEQAEEEVSSIISPGADIAGASVYRSVVSPDVRIHPGAFVADSVLLDGVVIGRGATIKRAVIDEHVVVPDRATVGADVTVHPACTTVTRHGIVVVGNAESTPGSPPAPGPAQLEDIIGCYYLG